MERNRIGMLRGLAASLGLLLAACPPAAAADEGEEDASRLLASAGRQLYVQHCAACHGSEARGDGPVADALSKRPPDLTRIAERAGGSFPAARVARVIDGRNEVTAHGVREMPVWGLRFGRDLPDEAADEVARGNISVLVDYLRTLQR